MEEYDVVVVGAGPSGSMSAFYASKNGLKVLLVEKRKEIGFPVQCGEIFPSLELVESLFKGLPSKEELFQIPEKFIDNKVGEISVGGSKKVHVSVPIDVLVVNREKLDKYFAEKAVEVGAELLTSTIARKIDRYNNVTLQNKKELFKVKTKIIVGADGAFSTVADQTSLPKNHVIYPTLQFVMNKVDIEQTVMQMFFDQVRAPDGFIWIIPKGSGIANVGLGGSPSLVNHAKLRSSLKDFIEEHPVAKEELSRARKVSITGGWVPVSGPLRETWKEEGERKVLLVGDAGGFVAPHLGAGIPGALVTGKLAGETAVLHLKNKKSLAVYEQLWRKSIGETLRNSLKVVEKIKPICRHQVKFEYLLGKVNPEIIKKAFLARITWQLRFLPLLSKFF